jgi:hypothetical protein
MMDAIRSSVTSDHRRATLRHIPEDGILHIILPVVLYVSETSSLTLREENRLRAFENRVLRSIYGPRINDLTRERRNL